MVKGRKIKRYSTCKYCHKSIPTVHLKYHEKVSCRVMRGLDPAPELEQEQEETVYTANSDETISDFLDRISKKTR